jgi:hypothetical protein
MKWILGIAAIGFIYYYFSKNSSLSFWKVAHAYPEEAYVFLKQNPCFIIFEDEPTGGYKTNLPKGEWEGPFKLPVPSQNRVVTIYGRSPEYQTAQDKFVRSLKG